MKIAMIGAEELEGQAVAKAFKQAKCVLTLLVEDVSQAKQQLGMGYEFKSCDTTKIGLLKKVLLGVDSVYISLKCVDESSSQQLISQIKNIVAACQFCNVKTIGLLSQSLVSEKNAHLFYEAAALYECEQLVKSSGLNYFIFCPAPFMECLPQYAHERQLYQYVKSEKTIHWLALKDFAQAVVKTYQNGSVKNARIILQGDSLHSLQEAMNIYVQEVYPGVKFENVEVFFSWLRVSFLANKDLLHGAKKARFLGQAYTEIDDKSEQGHWLLPHSKIQLKNWCSAQALEKRQEHTALSA
ncbi:MAG: NAD(P)H-binding protein [Bermanella sp.]